MTEILKPPAWMADGACAQVDPDLFFIEKGGSTKPAKEVCIGCPVRTACLEYALDRGEKFGVWGGKSELELRKLRKQQRLAREVAA